MNGREALLRKAWPIEKEDRKMLWAALIGISLGLLFLLGLLASWEPKQVTWRPPWRLGSRRRRPVTCGGPGGI